MLKKEDKYDLPVKVYLQHKNTDQINSLVRHNNDISISAINSIRIGFVITVT